MNPIGLFQLILLIKINQTLEMYFVQQFVMGKVKTVACIAGVQAVTCIVVLLSHSTVL
jgi:hypothetical protein